MENPNWLNDHIQFPRLIAEIEAVGLTPIQWLALRESMDLQSEELAELFERAQKKWDGIKAQT